MSRLAFPVQSNDGAAISAQAMRRRCTPQPLVSCRSHAAVTEAIGVAKDRHCVLLSLEAGRMDALLLQPQRPGFPLDHVILLGPVRDV